MVGTSIDDGDTQILLAVKNLELYALSDGGEAKTLGTIPCAWVVALTLSLKGINNSAMPNCGNLDFDP